MAEESKYLALALAAIEEALRPPLSVKRAAALLYQITVDNDLKVSVNPRKPMRGDSAFQTDLCVFEAKSAEVVLPRVVLEFKTRISTHDVITYSAKARRHKQVYPWLRYGLIASEESIIPRRFFVHNEALDFFIAAKDRPQLRHVFEEFVLQEVETSRKLERIAFSGDKPDVYRTEVLLSVNGKSSTTPRRTIAVHK